jgi:CubicO group peptidase (beta-lactamase class C family)
LGSCGDHLGEDAYGHTGFTGTSMWIDPDRDMFVILDESRARGPRAKRRPKSSPTFAPTSPTLPPSP